MSQSWSTQTTKQLYLVLSNLFSVFYSSIAVSKLEPELRDSIRSKHGDTVQLVYFNKGL